MIKLSLNRYKYTAFTKSLDEDFIKSISYEKNYYVVKNSNEMLMNSLLGENELELKTVFDIFYAKKWLDSIMYTVNVDFSKSVYTLLKIKSILSKIII